VTLKSRVRTAIPVKVIEAVYAEADSPNGNRLMPSSGAMAFKTSALANLNRLPDRKTFVIDFADV